MATLGAGCGLGPHDPVTTDACLDNTKYIWEALGIWRARQLSCQNTLWVRTDDEKQQWTLCCLNRWNRLLNYENTILSFKHPYQWIVDLWRDRAEYTMGRIESNHPESELFFTRMQQFRWGKLGLRMIILKPGLCTLFEIVPSRTRWTTNTSGNTNEWS